MISDFYFCVSKISPLRIVIVSFEVHNIHEWFIGGVCGEYYDSRLADKWSRLLGGSVWKNGTVALPVGIIITNCNEHYFLIFLSIAMPMLIHIFTMLIFV